MRKVVVCVQGMRFLAGAPAHHLAEAFAARGSGRCSFVGVCQGITDLSPQELFQLGGFVVTLSPQQAIEIPAGFLVAEASLSSNNVVIHWVTARAVPQDLQQVSDCIDACFKMARADAQNKDLSEAQRRVVSVTLAQLEAAAIAREWLAARSMSIEDASNEASANTGTPVPATLSPFRMRLSDSASSFRNAAPPLVGLVSQNREQSGL